MKTKLKYLIFSLMPLVFSTAACTGNQNVEEKPVPLYPQPETIEANPESGYTFNPVTGDTIKPIVNSLGDTLQTGVPIAVTGTKIYHDSVPIPKCYPVPPNDQLTKKYAHPNVHHIPDELTVIPVNHDSLTLIPVEEVTEDDTTHYIINAIGGKVPTGIPIPAKGKEVTTTQPQPIAALPLRFKDNAINNMGYIDVDQGLNSSYIRSMLEDKKGNLWFGTWGGGVSMYNGESFTHFTEKEGLSNNVVKSILEDKSGNLWFGTNGGGVSMYNGESFTHFTEKEGLSSNIVLTMLEDKNGKLWFGTEGGGVSMYNGESFTHYTKKEGLSNNYVHSIIEDKNGNLWFGTNGGGVTMYTGESFTHFTKNEGLSNNYVHSMLEDKKGNLWFGTWGGGVSMYNGEFFTHFTEKEGLSNNIVSSIQEDKNGNLWFSTNGGGVSMYNGKSFTHFTEKEGLNNIVMSILEDKNGNLWFGTNGGGVSIYNNESFTHFTEKEGLSNSYVWSILEDKNKNLWFGTWGGGVSMYNGESFIHYTEKEGLCNNIVLSILEDKNGNLWFGTYGGGVSMYNGKSFTHFTKKEGLSNNYVLSIQEDKNKNLWFGTEGGGVSMYNGESFTHFTEEEGLSNNIVRSILEDKNGNLWFTTYGGGVSMYNGESITHFTEKEGLSNNYVRSILEDTNGNLWFGTYGGGVSMLSFSSTEGYNDATFTYFTEEEGLSNNYVFSIIEYKKDQFWVSTEKGLTHFVLEGATDSVARSVTNVNDASLQIYFKDDGLKSVDFATNSVCLDSKNRMWWGSGKSLAMLDMNKFSPSLKPPSIHLKQLDINEQFIDYRNMPDSLKNEVDFSGVERFENYPLNLELPYNKNHLTFHFAAIDWSAQHKIQYSYIMEGLNTSWSQPSHEAKADYRNLPYGDYTFKVTAIGESGEWSKPFEYKFQIHPPWWHTWYARAGYGIAGILLILGSVRWRTAKLKRRQIELENEIDLATKEIRSQKEEVEQQKGIVEEQHKEIIDSINYAERIQRSFLATKELLNSHLDKYFVYFNPKEAVSGDFYWAGELPNGNFAISCADSTGHGVPGAIMSILNISSIELAIKDGHTTPSEIFNYARTTIIERLKKDGSSEGGKDGMDASLISLNPDKTKMEYVAANNPIWIIRDGELIDIKGEKMPVGKHDLDHIHFKGGEFELQKGDLIYTMTDGFQDQFGGEKGKKFKVKPMKRLLLEIADLTMSEQYKKISDTFDLWKDNLEQVDDVCIFGLKV